MEKSSVNIQLNVYFLCSTEEITYIRVWNDMRESKRRIPVDKSAAAHLQKCVFTAQEVFSLHDGVGGQNQLVSAQRRLTWTAEHRLRKQTSA